MRTEFLEVKTRKQAEEKASWAAVIKKVEGGYRAWESEYDYLTWTNIKQVEDLKKIITKAINRHSSQQEQEEYYFEVNLSQGGKADITWFRNHDDTACDNKMFTLKKVKNGYRGYYHSSLNHEPTTKNNCIWSVSIDI